MPERRPKLQKLPDSSPTRSRREGRMARWTTWDGGPPRADVWGRSPNSGPEGPTDAWSSPRPAKGGPNAQQL
eukprot:13740772-Alexandrium_andersonii.AAC.1